MLEQCLGSHRKQAGASEVDEMITFITLPVRVDKMRILRADGEYHVDYGKPFLGWSLYSATDELSKLSPEVDFAYDWEGRMNSADVCIEQLMSSLRSWYFVGVYSFICEDRSVVEVIIVVVDTIDVVSFRQWRLYNISGWTHGREWCRRGLPQLPLPLITQNTTWLLPGRVFLSQTL